MLPLGQQSSEVVSQSAVSTRNEVSDQGNEIKLKIKDKNIRNCYQLQLAIFSDCSQELELRLSAHKVLLQRGVW